MKVLVCGGRNYSDTLQIASTLGEIHRERGIETIIQGGATGADHYAFLWANSNSINTETYIPDWKKYGRSAGPIRNKQMLVEGKPDLVVAFPGGRGTAHMKKIAREAGVQVLEA